MNFKKKPRLLSSVFGVIVVSMMSLTACSSSENESSSASDTAQASSDETYGSATYPVTVATQYNDVEVPEKPKK